MSAGVSSVLDVANRSHPGMVRAHNEDAIFVERMRALKIGDPLDAANHVGTLIDTKAVEDYLKAIEKAKVQGGKIIVEGGKLEGKNYE